MDRTNNEENIFNDLFFKPLIEFLRDHLFHELQLLHPNGARHFHEQRAIANLLGLRIDGDGLADNIVPNRPDTVFIESRREFETL